MRGKTMLSRIFLVFSILFLFIDAVFAQGLTRVMSGYSAISGPHAVLWIAREGGPIAMMLVEHEEARGYVRAMAEALVYGEEDPDAARRILVENARAYQRLLQQHIRKEDEILFVLADEALTATEQRDLVRKFKEHEAKEMGPGIHEKYLKMAEELETSLNVG
jgi:hemerythrin-like domain-containing protein